MSPLKEKRKGPPYPQHEHLVRIFACFPGSEIEGPAPVSKDFCHYLVGYPLRQLGLANVKRPDGRIHTHVRTSIPFDRWGDGAGDLLAGDPVPGPTDESIEAARRDLDSLLQLHACPEGLADPDDPEKAVPLAVLVPPLPTDDSTERIMPDQDWTANLSEGETLAWARFREYVREHGRPAGVIKDVGEAEWACRLSPQRGRGVSIAEFTGMKVAGVEAGALRIREHGKFEVPELMAAISPSTRRVRRHRRRHTGRPVAENQPWWTIADAREMARGIEDADEPRPALSRAILEAADLLFYELRDPDPLATIQAHMQGWRFARKRYKQAPPDPIDWLSSAIGSQLRRRVTLAVQAPSG